MAAPASRERVGREEVPAEERERENPARQCGKEKQAGAGAEERLASAG